MEVLPPKAALNVSEKLQDAGGGGGEWQWEDCTTGEADGVGPGPSGPVEAKRPGKSLSLVQMFSELDDYFLRALEIANEYAIRSIAVVDRYGFDCQIWFSHGQMPRRNPFTKKRTARADSSSSRLLDKTGRAIWANMEGFPRSVAASSSSD